MLKCSVLLGTCVVVYALCAGVDVLVGNDIKWQGNLLAVVVCAVVFLVDWRAKRRKND